MAQKRVCCIYTAFTINKHSSVPKSSPVLLFAMSNSCPFRLVFLIPVKTGTALTGSLFFSWYSQAKYFNIWSTEPRPRRFVTGIAEDQCIITAHVLKAAAVLLNTVFSERVTPGKEWTCGTWQHANMWKLTSRLREQHILLKIALQPHRFCFFSSRHCYPDRSTDLMSKECLLSSFFESAAIKFWFFWSMSVYIYI